MKHRRSTARRIGSPIVSVIALGAAACSSSEGSRDNNPFRAETHDEVIGNTSQAATKAEATTDGGAPPPIGLDAGGPIPSDSGMGGSAGAAGVAGTGGGPGSCGNGIVEASEQCDGRNLNGETCESVTLGARPNGVLFCSPGCTFDTSNCAAIGGGGTGGTGSFDGGPPKGGSGGIAGGGGGGGQPGAPSAFWMFDDCSAVTRTLLDSSGNGIHAQRTVSAACAPGIQGQAIDFNEAGDRVEALNAPQFALDQRIAAAAWVNPRRIDDNRPIVLKRLNNKTAFSLRIQNGQAQFEIVLDNGKSTISRAPIVANTWSHVAGLFDGRFVFLFINGEQVGQIFAEGSIRDVDAPLRIGATTQTQRFDGLIDNVFVSTNPISGADIAALSCIRQPSTLEVSPLSSGPVQAGTAFTYDVDVMNNDIGRCQPRNYQIQAFSQQSGINVFSQPPFIPGVVSGQTANFDLVVQSDESVEPGVFNIPFFVADFSVFQQLFGSVQYEVAEPTGCHVKTAREIMIRNPGVVDDFTRTTFNGPPGDPNTGAWTFGRLMEQAAASPEQATEMVERVFNTWLSDQTVNSFTVAARPAITPAVLDFWPRGGDGRIDLRQSPLRLLAIVNRFDLRNLDQGHAGEGRFVFGVLGPFGQPLEFTVILEYMLPASTEDEVRGWAEGFHALSSHGFPSPEYNAALQALTDRFTARGAGPGRPNDSALLTLRTNEIALSFQWELREFRLNAEGFLEPRTVQLTPDGQFNGTQTLADFINANEADIVAERHVVPDSFQGAPFLGGAIFNSGFGFWNAFGIFNNEARHKFGLNTCNGCHGGETQTSFLHVSPRFLGSEAQLSGFMTGIDVFDPFSGQSRRLNDLGRRNADLKNVVCPPEPPPPPPLGGTAGAANPAAAASPTTTLRKGITRVH